MGTFADVLAQLRAADITSLAPKLASMGICDMGQLNGMTPEQMMGVAATYQELECLCHMLHRPIRDFQQDHRTIERISPPLAHQPEDPSLAAAHPDA